MRYAFISISRPAADPHRYLPFLAELQALPPLIQRFRIDVHLNRNLKALHSIAQYAPRTTQCLSGRVDNCTSHSRTQSLSHVTHCTLGPVTSTSIH